MNRIREFFKLLDIDLVIVSEVLQLLQGYVMNLQYNIQSKYTDL